MAGESADASFLLGMLDMLVQDLATMDPERAEPSALVAAATVGERILDEARDRGSVIDRPVFTRLIQLNVTLRRVANGEEDGGAAAFAISRLLEAVTETYGNVRRPLPDGPSARFHN